MNESKYRIPVSQPNLSDLERKYLLEAYDSHWLSRGYWTERFEQQFAEYLGVKHVLATSSGTTACHLAALTSGLQPYHNFYVPNLTFIATANSCVMSEIGVILGEVNEDSWNLDIKFFLEKEMFKKVKGIYLVDLLGNPVNIEQWHKIAKQYDLVLIHDACESLGGEISYAGKKYKCGSLFVESSVFSFYTNKNIVGGGESGCLCTNRDDIYNEAYLLHGQYQKPNQRYYHEEIGFNYRMNNLSGAILCAQLERIEEILSEKRRVFEQYQHLFSNSHVKMQKINEGSVHSAWICGVQLKNRANVEYELEEAGIETRRMFVPLNLNPPYEHNYPFAISQNLYDTTLMLPSYCQLTNKQVKEIVDIVLKAEEG